MDDSTNITTELDQTDEGILTYEVSDDALEAAAGTGERDGNFFSVSPSYCPGFPSC